MLAGALRGWLSPGLCRTRLLSDSQVSKRKEGRPRPVCEQEAQTAGQPKGDGVVRWRQDGSEAAATPCLVQAVRLCIWDSLPAWFPRSPWLVTLCSRGLDQRDGPAAWVQSHQVILQGCHARPLASAAPRGCPLSVSLEGLAEACHGKPLS